MKYYFGPLGHFHISTRVSEFRLNIELLAAQCISILILCMKRVSNSRMIWLLKTIFHFFYSLQVNKMAHLEELHIKNLKIRSLHMGLLLLDNLPLLKKASTFLLDIYGQDLILFKQKLLFLKQKQGLVLDYKEWWTNDNNEWYRIIFKLNCNCGYAPTNSCCWFFFSWK